MIRAGEVIKMACYCLKGRNSISGSGQLWDFYLRHNVQGSSRIHRVICSNGMCDSFPGVKQLEFEANH